jgi:antigen flippase
MAELTETSSAAARGRSYRHILKVSALIGGSAAFDMAVGVLRTKVFALLLGPAGYGLMGAYGLIVELSRSVAQLGINASGVRQIADAQAASDALRIARTVTVLRRVSLACALLGAAALVALAGPVSTLTFGDDAHRGAVALLAVAVFLSVLNAGQGALLQGMRRIGDLAKVAVVGSVLGTAVGVPLVWFWGHDGLVPTIVAVAAGSLAASWWYSRRIGIGALRISITTREFGREAAALIRLGVVLMSSGLLMAGVTWAVRIIVLRHEGLTGAGIYQAAAVLAGLCTGFVLQALGADFYPRLVGVADDDAACNRLVNEQARISLLLATPCVIGTVTVAPFVLQLLYSAQFVPATDAMRWICLGMALRVLTWPIGMVVIAKNRQAWFLAIEIAWAATNLALSAWCVARLGVTGAGVAFFASYVVHALVVFPVVRHLSDFRWTEGNRATAAWSALALGGVFVGFEWLPDGVALALGIAVTLASVWLSARTLIRLAQPQQVPRSLQRLLHLHGAAT